MKVFEPTVFFNISSHQQFRPAALSFGTSSRAYKNNRETLVQDNLVLSNTWLFRDDVDWNRLAKYMEKTFQNKGRVHLYSVAASDGSEAFTLAMTLDKLFKKKTLKKFLPIKASDRDEVIVNASQSGLINLRAKDIIRIVEKDIEPKKYFTVSKKRLSIDDDARVPGMHTYKISNFLKDAVVFEKAELLDRLKSIEDNSNTVVFCRNVTPYLSPSEVLDVALVASKKLKKGSIFVIGKYDSNTDIADYLKNLGFQCVMRNVFQKVV